MGLEDIANKGFHLKTNEIHANGITGEEQAKYKEDFNRNIGFEEAWATNNSHTEVKKKTPKWITNLKIAGLIGLTTLITSCYERCDPNTNLNPGIEFQDADGNVLPNPYSGEAGSTLNGKIIMQDPDGDRIDIAEFDGQNMIPLDTNPAEDILEVPFSAILPANGLETEYLAEAVDARNGVGSKTLTLKGLDLGFPTANIYVNGEVVNGSTTVDPDLLYSLRIEANDDGAISKVMLNSTDITALDTNPDAAIFEYDSTNRVAPADGVTETLDFAITDDESQITNKSVDVVGEFPPIVGDMRASLYGFYHDNDSETIETVLTDNTNASFASQYDTVEFYLGGVFQGTAARNGSVDVKDTANLVGSNLEMKMKMYKGTELVHTHIESIDNVDSLNNDPTIAVDENYGTPDDGFMSGAAGSNFTYFLDIADSNGDPLTLVTDYGTINPSDVSITDFGSYYGVIVDSDNMSSGAYNMRHKIQDNHNGESDWEDITIQIN